MIFSTDNIDEKNDDDIDEKQDEYEESSGDEAYVANPDDLIYSNNYWTKPIIPSKIVSIGDNDKKKNKKDFLNKFNININEQPSITAHCAIYGKKNQDAQISVHKSLRENAIFLQRRSKVKYIIHNT